MGQTGIGGGWQTAGGVSPTNNSNLIYDATASGTDTYTTPAITGVTSLFTGLKVAVKFTNANTTASTLQIGALAVTAIRKANIALVGGDITANTTYILEYDGTVFQMLNDIDRPLYAVASGTDTYTATLSPAIGGYGTGYSFLIKFSNANTGASTLNLNGLGAKTIQKSGSALIAGDIVANGTYLLLYDGTNFQLEISGDTFTIPLFAGQLSPADSTTYYFGLGNIVPTTTDTANDFNIGYAFTIIGAVINISGNTVSGSTENNVAQIRNTTTATSSVIGNFLSNASSTTNVVTTITGLNITIASGDNIAGQWDAPAYATNPTATVIRMLLICKRT